MLFAADAEGFAAGDSAPDISAGEADGPRFCAIEGTGAATVTETADRAAGLDIWAEGLAADGAGELDFCATGACDTATDFCMAGADAAGAATDAEICAACPPAEDDCPAAEDFGADGAAGAA